jgi:hypothetical protein
MNLLSIISMMSGGNDATTPPPGPTGAPTNFAEFEAYAATVRSRETPGNPFIVYETGTWKARQVHFPYVIEDPFDNTKLIMLYGGGSVSEGSTYRIGRATATKANPYVWTEYASNPVIDPADIVEAGTIVGVDDAWWNPVEERFELSCCTYNEAQSTSWLGKYYSNDGFVFTYEGVQIGPTGDELYLGNSGILRDGATWYCAYTYRIAGPGGILPGIRIASSTDNGATWTKHGNFLTLGPAFAYDDLYMEGVQFLKVGSDYILNYGCAQNNDGAVVFSGALAHSTTPLGTYTKSSINPYFEKSASGWDSTQVSTIVVFDVVEPWLLFWQGANGGGLYFNELWSMGMADFY